jgi:truncated hemoglobin YjbI/ankyrin repeat protein
MDAEPVSQALLSDTQDNLYHALGGRDGCHKLTVAFYAHVEHDPVLRPLYPRILSGCPIKALAAFLTQFLGGPCDYAERRWWLSLREAHLRFAIGQKERSAWLQDMWQAIDEMPTPEPTCSALRWFFVQASVALINQPPGAANLSLLSSDPLLEDQNEPETSPLHQDIAQRWEAHLTLEQLIAAVRQGEAEQALTLLEHLLVQATFTRDRAAFLSLLALFSGSQQEALLEYVRQKLISEPALAREHTLLYAAARQGSLPIVELLLHLGADPNASDGYGHTPLYFVGNGSPGTSGAAVVRVLVQGGANVNAQEKLKHCTALHMAARRGNVPVAQALLDCGAELEARDKLGETALHRAVKCGKEEMAAFLLSRGADAQARGKSGQTPWQAARGARMKKRLDSSGAGATARQERQPSR